MKTRVCITVDVEFSVAGALTNPGRNRPIGGPAVWGTVDGRSHGLGFMLEAFARHGVRATFFVEPLQRSYFGDEPMREVVHRILEAGQDVELHAHPVWRTFKSADWSDANVRAAADDRMDGRGERELAEILEEARFNLSRWTGREARVLRTGNLRCDRAVYRTAHGLGLRVSSNVGLGVFLPREPELRLHSGAHEVEGVVEIPVLSYLGFGVIAPRRWKSLTITGSTHRETVHLLERARARRIDPVVVLTHPFEFVRGHDAQFHGMRPHAVNQGRLLRLCEHLDRNRDRFETVGMTGLGESPPPPSVPEPPLAVPLLMALERVIANRLAGR